MIIDLMNRQFGRLLVIGMLAGRKHRKVRWLCLCECGASTIVAGTELRKEQTKSCGCYRRDVTRAKRLTHGFGNRRDDNPYRKEYEAWRSMTERCRNPHNKSYVNYGGRGIRVCSAWSHSFTRFLHDVGKAPYAHYWLERINNDGDYEPGNVTWATPAQQYINRRKPTCKQCQRLLLTLLAVLRAQKVMDIYAAHKDVLA